jgi:hypothetical protein
MWLAAFLVIDAKAKAQAGMTGHDLHLADHGSFPIMGDGEILQLALKQF